MSELPDQPIRPPDRLDAMALRLASLLLLLGATIFAGLAIAVHHLPSVVRDGEPLYLLPGSDGQRGLEPLAIVVLVGTAGIFGILGIVGLAFSRRAWKRPDISLPARRPPAPGRQRRRPLRTLAIGVVVLAAVLMFRWVVRPA